MIQFSQRYIHLSMPGIDSFPLCTNLEVILFLHEAENDQEGKHNTKWVIKTIFQINLQLNLFFENLGTGLLFKIEFTCVSLISGFIHSQAHNRYL